MFVLPSAAHDFARTHMPGFVRMVLGFGEIAGCVLLLIPQTAIRGAWLLLAVFVMAIMIHLLHGAYNVGNLVIYGAAAFAIAVGGGHEKQREPACGRWTAEGGCPQTFPVSLKVRNWRIGLGTVVASLFFPPGPSFLSPPPAALPPASNASFLFLRLMRR